MDFSAVYQRKVGVGVFSKLPKSGENTNNGERGRTKSMTKDGLLTLQEIKEAYHRANFVEAPGGYIVGVYRHKAKPDSTYDRDGWRGLVFRQVEENRFEYLSESAHAYRQSTKAIEWAYFMASELRNRENREVAEMPEIPPKTALV